MQLAKSKNDYVGLFNEKIIKNLNFINNRKLFVNFLEKKSEKKSILKPKCILIGTKNLPHTFDYYKNLYIKTLDEIKKSILSDLRKFFFSTPQR